MNNLFQNIIAVKDDNWIQLVIFIVIFAFAILKKLFSGLKNYADKQEYEKEHEPEQPLPAVKKPKHVYADDDFKTIEQIRDEKIAQIRAAFGIPEPPKTPAEQFYEEAEPEPARTAAQQLRPAPLPQTAIREKMFTPQQTAYTPPPVYRPKIKKKAVQPKQAASKTPEHTEKQKKETKPAEEMIIKLSSRDDLRSAILYQEILGKPLALRD